MNKLDPDTEFYKSSLDACKSTIIQQESEIRKLRETLDIRNKRIVQLESQMGTAAINNASRPTEITTTDVRVVQNLVFTEISCGKYFFPLFLIQIRYPESFVQKFNHLRLPQSTLNL